jgi:hypothetical protein
VKIELLHQIRAVRFDSRQPEIEERGDLLI